MIKYEKQILNALLDKYERSKSFIGTNQVTQRFTIQPETLFPKYKDDSEFELYCAVNESIDHLEKQGYIEVKKYKNGVVQRVALIITKLNDIYAYIDRKPKTDTVSELRNLLLHYKDANVILSAYCVRQLERLNLNKSVEFFDDDLPGFETALKVVSEITNVENEMFERDFSIKILGDSKAFEHVRSKVVSLLYEYGDFPEKETLLADLNIVKNPGHVYFKGAGTISICGQKIDFSKMDGDIAISSVMLKNIDSIKVLGSTVITIENLTTFNAFKCTDAFAIYLGGYHNTNRRNFIRKVYNQNPNKIFLHFGDIDAGGFYILENLRKRTGINFSPYKMDAETLKENLAFAKKLTENDKKRLTMLLDSEYEDTIRFMLDNDCKLEQEAMDLANIGI